MQFHSVMIRFFKCKIIFASRGSDVFAPQPRRPVHQPPTPAQTSRHRADEGDQTANHPSHPSDPPRSAEKTTVIIHPWHSHRRLPLDAHTQPHTYKDTEAKKIHSRSLQMPQHLLSFPFIELSSPSINPHYTQKCQNSQQMTWNPIAWQVPGTS